MKFQPKVCEVTYDPTGIREQRKNEAEIVQRQVHLIEENRSAARKEQKYQTMHIQIPNSPRVKPVENSEMQLIL